MEQKLIVFKIGTSSLTKTDGQIDPQKIIEITRQLSILHQEGHHLVVVTSGSIAAGFRLLGFEKRPSKVAQKQASAAVGQGLLIEQYTKALLTHGIISAQVLLTQDDFVDRRRYLNAAQALNVLISRGAIPIINENDTVAVEEIKVGDNDTLSAQVASLIQADLLVLLTDVDGLYTANPRVDTSAQHLPVIDKITPEIRTMAAGAGSANATGGMMTKVSAAQLATQAGIPVFVCSSKEPDALIQAVTQQNKGTLFAPAMIQLKQRKHWLAYYARPQGALTIDQGAVQALRNRGSSLLASGVLAVEGEFKSGAMVEVYDEEQHQLIGKGKVRQSSGAIMSKQGVVIHRDDWVAIEEE